jgi:uncharacterized protein YjbI with pentapeptide repeats
MHTKELQMNVNGYEIKPFAYLRGANLVNADLRDANLVGANFRGANLTGTILEKEEVTQDNTSLSQRVKELEEENDKLKSTLKSLKALLNT